MSFTSAQRRDLVLVAGGRAVSLLGDEAAVIALALWASRQGAGTIAVAALVMAGALPQLLAAPVAGLLVDRLPARPLIATVSLLQAAVCLALVPAAGGGDLAAVVVLVIVLGVGQTVANPAWQALVPAIVGPELVGRALGRVQAAAAAAMLLGPALGGLVEGSAGVGLALVLDAATFAVLACVALALRTDRRPEPRGGREPGEVSAGVRVILDDPVLRSVLLLVTALVLGAGAINVAEIFLVTRTLGASPAVYGLVGALFAGGVMVGSLLGGRDRSVRAAGRTLVGVTVSMAASMVVLGLSPSVAVAAVASLAVGVGNGMLNVLAQSVFVRRSPAEVLGRVFAALQGVVGAAMLVATGVGGLLLGVLDVRTVIVGSGLVAVTALVAVSRPLLTGDPAPSSQHLDDAAATRPRALAPATEGGEAA